MSKDRALFVVFFIFFFYGIVSPRLCLTFCSIIFLCVRFWQFDHIMQKNLLIFAVAQTLFLVNCVLLPSFLLRALFVFVGHFCGQCVSALSFAVFFFVTWLFPESKSSGVHLSSVCPCYEGCRLISPVAIQLATRSSMLLCLYTKRGIDVRCVPRFSSSGF